MDPEVKKCLEALHKACTDLQKHVIGVADIGGTVETVVDYHNGVATTVRVGTLLGVAETHTGISGINNLKIFGEDQTLDLLMNDPHKLKDIVTF